MGSNRLERGQIVTVSFEYKDYFGVIEYLKMSDGTILNVHDNVITGNGDKNTKVEVFVNLLYAFETKLTWWSTTVVPQVKLEGNQVFPINPHNVYIVTDEQIDDLFNKWNAKIEFMRSLKEIKPQLKEINK